MILKWISVKAFAEKFDICEATVYRNAVKFGGVKVGRWRFPPDAVYTKPGPVQKGGICQSDNAETSGGFTSPLRMEKELDALLEQRIGRQHRKSTTSSRTNSGG